MGIKRVTMKDKELKERFFALYFGQDVLRVAPTQLELLSKQWNWGHNDFYLELKPLSSISDEELSECVNQIFHRDQQVRDARINYDEVIYQYRWKEEGFTEEWVNSVCFTNSLHDAIRSKGFACDWMGISVEEQEQKGWIKLVE